MSARRWLVAGRVQGVSFRAWTQARAFALGLAGHAINLPDGYVEVLARGEEDALDQMELWLHHGPPAARVDAVQAAPAVDAEVPSIEFTVR